MNNFFQEQLDYIFFFYGLSFLFLAVVCFMLVQKKDRKLSWLWLGLFGLIHGLNEWLDLFAISIGDNPTFYFVRLGAMSLSFILLFEFARRSYTLGGNNFKLWIYIPVFALATLGFPYGITSLNVTCRYFLGFTSASFSALVVYKASKATKDDGQSLRFLSAMIALYAIVTGLVVPKSTFMPARWINYDSFVNILGFPIQLLRGFCALFSALAIWVYTNRLFKIRLNKKEYSLRLYLSNWIAMILSLLILSGWFFTSYAGNHAKRELIKNNKADLTVLSNSLVYELTKTQQASMSLSGNPSVVSFLMSRNPTDIENVNYALDRYTGSFGFSVCYLLNKEGVVVASSNRNNPDSFVGKSYNFRPYFKQAILGVLGTYFAKGVTSGERGYYAAYPVKENSGRIIGVCAIKKNISDIDYNFRYYPYTFLISPQGVIFSASENEFLLNCLWPIGLKTKKEIIATRQFEGGLSKTVFSSEVADGQKVNYKGRNFYVSRNFINNQGWSIVLLGSLDTISHYRLFSIILVLFLCVLAIVLFVAVKQREDLYASIVNAQSAIKNQLHLLQVFIDAIPNPIFYKDTDLKYLGCNSAFERYSGLPKDKIIGKTAYDINPQDQVDRYNQMDLILLDQPGVQFYETSVLYPDYTRHDIILNKATFNKQDGSVGGLVGIIIDISERKQAERMLKASEAKYRELVENANSIILRMNKVGRVTFFNEFAEKFFGYKKEEIIGKNVVGTIVPQVSSSGVNLEEMILDIGCNPERYAVNENENMLRNGERVVIFWTNKPIFDDKGEVKEILCVGNDVTERNRSRVQLEKAYKELKEMQQKLIQTEKMAALGRFSSAIAHEVKNPLGIILGGVEVLERKLAKADPQIKTIVEKIKESTERADGIIQGLLKFARPSVLKVEKVRLNDLVSDAVSLFEYKANLVNVGIKTHFVKEQINVEVDRNQIQQVLFNVLANAIEAMPDGGVINVETYKSVSRQDREAQVCIIEISDTGVGISKEDYPKIFEPFFTTKLTRKGTGLGLSIAKMILDNHRGSIEIESEPDKGTKVKIILPLG